MNEEQQGFYPSSQNISSSTYTPPVDKSIIEYRLSTRAIILQIEANLRGVGIHEVKLKINPETGDYEDVFPDNQCPKANEEGIRSIVNWVATTINNATVQGNFFQDKGGYSDELADYLSRYHRDLSRYIFINLYNWDIADEDFEGLVDNIMHMVEPFMTRTKNNEERLSLSQGFRTVESSTMQEKPKQRFRLFARN